jgi:GNAT superfamily N-acetyltransferase
MKPAIKELDDQYRAWAHNLLTERWGSHFVVSRGRVYEADRLPGFVAFIEAKPKGLITYRIINEECEVVTLDSLIGGIEIGTALLDAVKRVAEMHGCQRIWLITTNDNLPALKFYQKRDYRLAAVHRDALTRSRQLKPSIPEIGLDGIPLRDEIELELSLNSVKEQDN